jgi:sugar phosphate isomerase/epimerase
MLDKTQESRRSFLVRGLSVAATTALLDPSTSTLQAAESETQEVQQRPVCIFAKHLQLMPWNELAAFCREIDVDGIEATIRRGGQVEPPDAAEKLPQLCEAMSSTNKQVIIMTTDINSVETPDAETVLRTGALSGVLYYRMAYYKYVLDKPILPQLDAFAKKAKELAALNHDLGITGLYQNHAGATNVGAPLWDMYQMLREIPNTDIGIAYDVRHATVEGNESWPIDLALIRDSIATVYAKDYQSVDGKIENVPLGEGDVSEALFTTLREQPPPGPISLHMEYISHHDPKLVQACADAYRNDRKALKRLLGV